MSALKIVSKSDGEAFHIGPIHIRVLEDGSRTDNRIGAVEITVPPHTDQTPPHLHRMHDETFLVTKGRLRFTTDEDHYDVDMGGYVVVPVGPAIPSRIPSKRLRCSSTHSPRPTTSTI
jgi:quercetin dioxygenase-like cupin family protein